MNHKQLTLIAIGTVSVVCTLAYAAATQCTINNTSSMSKSVEVRSGSNDNCDSNPLTGNYTIGSKQSIVVPYGGNVSKVCARTQGGNWYVAYCPTSDNSRCRINM
jgi:hypothetical protein